MGKQAKTDTRTYRKFISFSSIINNYAFVLVATLSLAQNVIKCHRLSKAKYKQQIQISSVLRVIR